VEGREGGKYNSQAQTLFTKSLRFVRIQVPKGELSNINSISMTTKSLIRRLLFGCMVFTALALQGAEPLRVFIRAGPKSHAPDTHDHPRFLAEWVPLLKERGMQAEGAMTFPTAEQFEKTDVLIVHADDGMKTNPEQRENFEKFLKRGGGFIVIHAGILSGNDSDWAKTVAGGVWIWANRGNTNQGATNRVGTKYFEGNVTLTIQDAAHPITRGAGNTRWRDEIYWDLDLMPDIHVLATSAARTNAQSPQMWTYEKTRPGGTAPYRAFVSIPGHEYASFSLPRYRGMLMRGIAWVARRPNVDEFVKAEELAAIPEAPKQPEPAPR
jgi:type 1 glutamine amidotransferase